MKRLFQLRDERGKVIENLGYFSNKMEAKTIRDSANSKCFVTYGPDHWRYSDA